MKILLDARLLNSGGIGRFIREVSKRWLKDSRVSEIYFLGSRSEISGWLPKFDVRGIGRVVRWPGSVYSVARQIAWPRVFHKLSKRVDACVFPHYDVPMVGHTNRGQFLGSPAAYGGSGLMLALDSYSPWGRWRASLLRESRDEGLAGCTSVACGNPTADGPTQDVMYSLGGEALWFRGRWEWTGGLTVTWNLNRNFESDQWNFRPTLRSRVSL